MTQPEERRFRLALAIEPYKPGVGAHAQLVLVDEDEHDSPLLAIQAGGVPESDEGAGIIADMLRDAADAIDEYLGKERPHTDTSALPTVHMNTPTPPKRPRFNPQPRGSKA